MTDYNDDARACEKSNQTRKVIIVILSLSMSNTISDVTGKVSWLQIR